MTTAVTGRNTGSPMPSKITVPELRARKSSAGRGDKLAMVTAYDATFARMFDGAGVDAILVGDSLGMVIQGGTSTLPVTRGTQRAHLIGDMPFMSYQTSSDAALLSAGRLMKEGGAESVKLEGGQEIADVIRRMVRMGIPVMAHVGLMPQRVHAMGGFKVQGRSEGGADAILEDAIAVGAGVGCDGQILVSYDLLGLNDTMKPRFVKRFQEFFRLGTEATRAYVDEVRNSTFPGPEHSFGLPVEPRNPVADALSPRHAPATYGPTH